MPYQIIKERPKNIFVYLDFFWFGFGLSYFIIKFFPINDPRRSFLAIYKGLAEIIWNIIKIPFRITYFINKTDKLNIRQTKTDLLTPCIINCYSLQHLNYCFFALCIVNLKSNSLLLRN